MPLNCAYFVISPTPLLMRVLINLRYFCPILLHNYILKLKFFVTDICLVIILSVVGVGIIENRDMSMKYKIWKIYIKKGFRYKRDERKLENFRHVLISVWILSSTMYFCEDPFAPRLNSWESIVLWNICLLYSPPHASS